MFSSVDMVPAQYGTQEEYEVLYTNAVNKLELETFYYKDLECFYITKLENFLPREAAIGRMMVQVDPGNVNKFSIIVGYMMVPKEKYSICKYVYGGPSFLAILCLDEKRVFEKYSVKQKKTLQAYMHANVDAILKTIDERYEQLHRLEIIHNDVKLDNICIHPDTFNITLVDFDKSFVITSLMTTHEKFMKIDIELDSVSYMKNLIVSKCASIL